MRLNGLTLALATLLAPAAALAQQGPPVEPSPEPAAAVASEPVAAEPLPATMAPVEAPAEAPVGTPVEAPAEAPVGTPVATQAEAPVGTLETVETPVGTPAETPVGAPVETPLDVESPGEAPPEAPADAGVDTGTDIAQDPAASDDPRLVPTEAEKEFAEIYGQEYDPVADPSLPDPVTLPGAFDPWEKYNRKMHRFNNAVDRGVAKPLARGYVKVVPRPVRLGVSNFFSNLGQPLTALNSLLQGKPKQAGQALGRFLLNSTLGIGGIFDPARDAKIPHRNEDFGQTLGVWGWKRSRYFELPLFGPRTVRDVFGMVGDAPLSPIRGVEADKVRIPLQGLQLVDLRSQLLSTDSLREGAEDDYILVRDAWSQRRDYQIFGERAQDDAGLPDYLLEGEEQPTVPVDAMPMPPAGGSN